MSDIQKLWGEKIYDKILKEVDRGKITAKIGEKIASKLSERGVLSKFISSRNSNNNYEFDKDEFAKILDNWFQTFENARERKDALGKFIKVCKDVGLNSFAFDLEAMSHDEFLNLEEENKNLKEKITFLENEKTFLENERTNKQSKLEEDIERLQKKRKSKQRKSKI